MQHITLCTSYIAFMLVSHTCIIVIGHAEQGPEETPEPAQIEGVNPEQDQGQAPVHATTIRKFSLSFYTSIMILRCALGYRS
jgi:hypothetical protein